MNPIIIKPHALVPLYSLSATPDTVKSDSPSTAFPNVGALSANWAGAGELYRIFRRPTEGFIDPGFLGIHFTGIQIKKLSGADVVNETITCFIRVALLATSWDRLGLTWDNQPALGLSIFKIILSHQVKNYGATPVTLPPFDHRLRLEVPARVIGFMVELDTAMGSEYGVRATVPLDSADQHWTPTQV